MKKEITKYHNKIRDYYLRVTYVAVEEFMRKEKVRKFEHAFIYACHFFSNLSARDLDNRSRSFLINALRYAKVIPGDEWQKLTYMESGFLDVDKTNHVSFFVTDRKNGMKLAEYVEKLYKNGHRFRVSLEQFFCRQKVTK
jgi:hypothetical protein